MNEGRENLVQINRRVSPQAAQELKLLAKRLNVRENRALEIALHAAVERRISDADILRRIEVKLDQVLEDL
jgi:hypothetical protein